MATAAGPADAALPAVPASPADARTSTQAHSEQASVQTATAFQSIKPQQGKAAGSGNAVAAPAGRGVLPPSDNANSGTRAAPRRIAVGDLVIVYMAHNSMKHVTVDTSATCNTPLGPFKMADWVGKRYGERVYSASTGAWALLLVPTPELWTQVLLHRTQILYVADCAQICAGLELHPGAVVLESGTGSGSLTTSLARAVAPSGHVHTFEFHTERQRAAAAEFDLNGIARVVSCIQRDVEATGFPEELEGEADGVMLDVPAPWKAVPSAARCLKPNGRFVGFSPCIEQVQRTAAALRSNGMTDVRCIECLLRAFEVRSESVAPLALAAPTAVRQVALTAAAANTAAQGKLAPGMAKHAPEVTIQPDGAVAGNQSAQAAQPRADDTAMQIGNTTAGDVAHAVSHGANGQKLGGEAASGVQVGAKRTRPEAEDVSGVEIAEGQSMQQRSSHPAGQHAQPQAQGKASKSRQSNCEAVRRLSVAPAMNARGHTGYLLFARKFVLPAAAADMAHSGVEVARGNT